jgi:hypothetical protein
MIAAVLIVFPKMPRKNNSLLETAQYALRQERIFHKQNK